MTARQSPPTYFEVPKQFSGYELNTTRSYFSITVPETTINYFLSPSFENADNDTETQSANVTPTYDTTQSFRGRYSRKIAVSSTAANYFAKRFTASAGVFDTPGSPGTFSCYILSPTGESFKLEVHSSIDAYATAIAASEVFAGDGTWKRAFLKFTLPAGATNSTTYEFRVIRTNATTNPYYTDAWQLEAKAYPTTYCDGNENGCSWLGTEGNSTSLRPDGVIGGHEYNLKTDLNLMVTGYVGTDMPPLQHMSVKRALAGGEFYQRTLPTYRVMTISCSVIQNSLMNVQQVKELLLNLFAPDLLGSIARPLLLTYQTCDNIGNPIGKIMDAEVRYLAGLEGNQDNNHSETFTFQFNEYVPPSIQERPEIGLLPTIQATDGGEQGYIRQFINNSTWRASGSLGAPFYGFLETPDGYYIAICGQGGLSAYITRSLPYSTYTLTSSIIGGAGTNPGDNLAVAGNNSTNGLFVGGSWTSFAGGGAAYLVKQTALTTWVAIASGPNNTVRALLMDRGGLLYVAGDFTTPANRFARYNGSGWDTIGGTNLSGVARCLAIGLDGAIYVGGDFVTANGTTVNYIAKYDPVANAWSALGSGMSGASVRALAVGLDGKLYAAGDFVSAGGVTVNKIAVWNGNQWAPLGAGLNGNVTCMSVGPDGILYVGGAFTATSDSAVSFPGKLAMWTGSQWLPIPLKGGGNPSINALLVTQRRDILVGLSDDGVNPSTFAATTSVTYNGSAGVKPKIVIRGPGTLYQISNNTTGAAIYLNYTLQAGEVATLVLSGSSPVFTSNYQGNVMGKILPGSNVSGFGLRPGVNALACYIGGTTSGTTAIEMYYHNKHWGFAASGGA